MLAWWWRSRDWHTATPAHNHPVLQHQVILPTIYTEYLHHLHYLYTIYTLYTHYLHYLYSIYTHTQEGSTPLIEVMRKIHEEFEGDTGLDKNSDGEELKSFLKHILPDYDEDRVYVSDIKKLVTWYNLLAKIAPESFMEQPADEAPEEKEAE